LEFVAIAVLIGYGYSVGVFLGEVLPVFPMDNSNVLMKFGFPGHKKPRKK